MKYRVWVWFRSSAFSWDAHTAAWGDLQSVLDGVVTWERLES